MSSATMNATDATNTTGTTNATGTADTMDRAARLDGLTEFLASSDDGSFYIGHASVLLRISGKKYLVDPVLPRPLFLDSWLFFPPLALDARLLEVDGVFISHCHEDHYDLRFLRELAPGTPIYITEGRIGFEALTSEPRFNVKRLPAFELAPIDAGVEALALPSSHNNIDSSFVIRGKGFALYQGNDNFLDEASVARARALAGPVDHAYIPYAYVWWYPFCLTSIGDEQRAAEAKRLNERNMKIGQMIGRVLEAALVIPSAGNLAFYNSADSVINRGIASPFDYLDFVRRDDPANASRVHTLFAGDHALKGSSGHRIAQAPLTRAQYFAKMDVFLKAWNAKTPPLPPRAHLDERELAPLRARVHAAPSPTFDWTIYIVRMECSMPAVAIDMRTGAVTIERSYPLADRTKIFHLEAFAFEQWLAGAISLETVLNSQRFTLERAPEVFEPDVWAYLRQYV